MTVGAITALTFSKLDQVTIKEWLGVWKHAASRGFFATTRLLFQKVLTTTLPVNDILCVCVE